MRSAVMLLAVLAVAGCTTETGGSRVGQYVNPCNPNNAPPGAQASVLHQDRPGGSDCTRTSAQRAYEVAPPPAAAPTPYYQRY